MNTSSIHEAEYTYHTDGKLNVLDSDPDAPFSQANKYDFAGRLKENDVGSPYEQTLSYDAFDNLTARTTRTHTFSPVTFSATYSNNRKSTGGASQGYDAAGNVTSSLQSSPVDNFYWNFDAAGRQAHWTEFGPYGENQWKGERITFDGDGHPAKRAALTKIRIGGVWGDWVETNSYNIYSSVTGKNITELLEDGGHYRTHVYYGDTNFADERNGDIYFIATDPISGSTREVFESGEIPPSDESESRNELGGLGISIPHSEPPSMPAPNYLKGGFAGGAEGGCVVDGFTRSPEICTRGLANGTMEQCPNNDCGPRVIKDKHGRERFTLPYSFSGGIGGWGVQDDKKKRKKKKQPPILIVREKEEARLRKQAHQKAGYIPDPRDPEAEYIHAPLPEAVELGDKIVERLDADEGRCRKFLDSVRHNLNIEETVEELYDELIDNGGRVVIAHDIASAGVAYYGEDKKDIGLAPVSDSAERYTNHAIHELFHRAGRGHRSFAEAGFDSLSEMDQATFPLPKVKSPGSQDMDDTYSNYFSRLQNYFCKPKL